MPSVSKAQHNYMAGIAHGMIPRTGNGPSIAIAKEFVAADKEKSGRQKIAKALIGKKP